MNRSAHTAVVTLAAAIALVVAGCQPSSPSPSPTTSPTSPSPVPTPSHMCTPEAGGDEAPCSEIQYNEMKVKDALYAEAEAVYREYWAEVVRIMRLGGVVEPTEVLLRTTDGFQLEDVVSRLSQLAADGVVARGEDPQIIWIRRLAGQSKSGSLVALATCVDATKWGFYAGDKLKFPGRAAADDLYFSRVDGVLKIIGADGQDATSCD